jgi:hypothetical protein
LSEILRVLFGALFTLAAGYSLGFVLFSKLPLPHTIRLAAGSAILSHLIFVALLVRAGRWWVFLAIGAAVILAAALKARWALPAGPPVGWLPAAVFVSYGAYYLVHALTPEIRPDGYTYHLGLPAEWLRLGGFPRRIGFYEMLPQGMEMLFAFAFAFGKHSAAKLVHFALLAASVPLMFAIGRRLDLPTWASAAGAGLYFCAPVVGAAGTAAYNDAALVFFALAALYLLLAWWQEGQNAYVLPLGLVAGFCYAIKPTGLIVAPAVVALVAARRRWKPAVLVAAGVAAMVAPWMIRNAVLTGNPLAPLMNRLFPNPYFHISTEERLARSLRSYEGVTWVNLPWEATMRGQRLHGLIGPVFLLAPLALLALRRKTGRWLLAASALLAVPWLLNIGARFLMPSLAFLALALAAALPRRLALACLMLQAVLSLPPVVAAYSAPGAWRLEGLPWRAALRIEPEHEYLRRRLWEYRVAELIREHVPRDGRVLDLLGAPTAYFDAEAITPWHSAAGDRLGYALQVSLVVEPGVFSEIEYRWPERELTAVRFARTTAGEAQWGISEVQLFQGQDSLALQPGWRFLARPNVWEARFAFDRNWMSRWGTWEPVKPGVHLGVDFGGPVRIDRAKLICLTHEQEGPVECHGRTLRGHWDSLAHSPEVRRLPALNRRLSAMRLVRQEGIGYILAPTGETGYGPAGEALSERPADWGLELLGQAGNVFLFRLR